MPYSEWWPEEFEEDDGDDETLPSDEAEAGIPNVLVVIEDDLPF